MSRAGDIFAWSSRVRRQGLSVLARDELRKLLAPRVIPRRAIRLDFLEEGLGEEGRRLDFDIVLATDVQRPDLGEGGVFGLGTLLDDFTVLLREAMDLMRAVGDADDREDPSYHEHPSIEEHPQNQRFHRWTLLIELTRDAWIDVAETDPERARLVAEAWWGHALSGLPQAGAFRGDAHGGDRDGSRRELAGRRRGMVALVDLHPTRGLKTAGGVGGAIGRRTQNSGRASRG